MTGNESDFSQDITDAGVPEAVGFITTDEAALMEDQQRLEDAYEADAARHQQEFLDAQEKQNTGKDTEFTATTDSPAAEETEETEASTTGADNDTAHAAENLLQYDEKLIESLCALYHIPEIPDNFKDNMGGMTAHYIMPDEKDIETPVMIAIVHDDSVMEVTQSRVLSHPEVTAQTAYDMALLAALNPKMMDDGVTLLPGSDEDRVLLYHAAKAFGLTVSNEHELTPEQRATPPESWKALLAEKGMPYEEKTEEPSAEQQEQAATENEQDPQAGYEHTEPENAAPDHDFSLEDDTATVFDVSAPVTPVDFGPQIDSAQTSVDYPLANDPVLNGTYPEPETTVYFDDVLQSEKDTAETATEAVTEEEQEAAPAALPSPEQFEKNTGAPATEDHDEEPASSAHLHEDSEDMNEYMLAANDENQIEDHAEVEEESLRTAAEAKKAPVSEESMTALFNANVAKKTYMEARKQVINEGKASRSFLRESFNLTDKQAKTVQACLREENVIAKQGANKHVVLVQPS